MAIKTYPIDSEKAFTHTSQLEQLNKLISDYMETHPHIDVVSISHCITPYHGEFLGSAIITYKEQDIAIKDDGD